MTRKHLILSALILAPSSLAACAGYGESGAENLGFAEQGVGGTGNNDLLPSAVDSMPLARPTLNAANITTPTIADPLQICADGSVSGSGCDLHPTWETWMDDDLANRSSMMKAMVKCMAEPGFTVTTSDSTTFAGQWGLYQGWKSSRLNGQDKRERMSSCILTLLNGNNQTLALCIIGPGGAPFSDACTDPAITTREAGFFGDLFATTPKAYVVGPKTDTMVDSGRACTSSQSQSYCCAEASTNCPHHIYKAGGMQGTNSRCNAFATVNSGTTTFTYCTEFWTSREPGKVYSNVFTSFVPAAQ